jgi:hypothetical protein
MEALIKSNAEFMFCNDQMTFGSNQAPTSNEVQSNNDASHQGIGSGHSLPQGGA